MTMNLIKEGVESDSQTKKKVPAIDKMVFMKIAEASINPWTMGKFQGFSQRLNNGNPQGTNTCVYGPESQ